MKINRDLPLREGELTLESVKHSHPFQFVEGVCHGRALGTDLGRIYIKIYPCTDYDYATINVGSGHVLITDLEQGIIKAVPRDLIVRLLDYDFRVRGSRKRSG